MLLLLAVLSTALPYCVQSGWVEGDEILLGSDVGSLTVRTSSGILIGNVSAQGVVSFLGVPYATAQRFGDPVLLSTPNATPQTTDFGAPCIQPADNAEGFVGVEDCLTLNIWMSEAAVGKKDLPVLVWIYGGGFVDGLSSNPLYSGANIAKVSGLAEGLPVIVVSMNYRLGPFGFFATAAGTNFGLKDQQAALQWVQNNIAYFGGNPAHVTLWGQSAGGISTCLHLLSPASAGLFSATIIDSGNCGSPMRPLEFQSFLSANLSLVLGCPPAGPDTIPCLQNRTVVEVMAANFEIGGAAIFGKYGGPLWQPSLDGVAIREQPLTTLTSRRVPNIVPVLMGATTGSMTIFMLGAPALDPQTSAGLNMLVKALLEPLAAFPEFIDTAALIPIYEYYTDLSNFGGSTRSAAAAFLSDEFFVCGTRRDVGFLASSGLPAYYWMWNETLPCYGVAPAPCRPIPSWLGPFHGSDLGFWFGTGDIYSDVAANLTSSMMTTLLNFVRRRDPNPVPGLNHEWNVIGLPPQLSPVMFQEQMQQIPSFRDTACGLWDAAIKPGAYSVLLETESSFHSVSAGFAVFVVVIFVMGSIAIVAAFAIKGHRLVQRGALLQRTASVGGGTELTLSTSEDITRHGAHV